MPVWGTPESAATGLQMRHQYGTNGVVDETKTMFATWRGMNAYYSFGVRPVNDPPAYENVRDQVFQLGPGDFLENDILVGAPSGMFNTENWVYGTIPNGVLIHYDAIRLLRATLNDRVDSVLNVYEINSWVVGTVGWGFAPGGGVSIADWIATREADSPAPTTAGPIASVGNIPGPVNRYASWIIAFTPDGAAPLDTYQTLLHAEGVSAGVQRFTTFSYQLIS